MLVMSSKVVTLRDTRQSKDLVGRAFVLDRPNAFATGH